MTIDYSEKRDFIRMRTDSPLKYKIVGTDSYITAQCVDLSASGILISTENSIMPGTRMDVEIRLEKSLVPSFIATVEVVRSLSAADGHYQIGASIIATN